MVAALVDWAVDWTEDFWSVSCDMEGVVDGSESSWEWWEPWFCPKDILDMEKISGQEEARDSPDEVGETRVFSPSSKCWISRATALQMGQEGSAHRSLRTLPSWGSQPCLGRKTWQQLTMEWQVCGLEIIPALPSPTRPGACTPWAF